MDYKLSSLSALFTLTLKTLLPVVSFYAAVFLGIAHADEASKLEFFESRIRPVLIEHCYECHSSESSGLKGGLYVDSSDGLRLGGDSGPAIETDNSEASLLMQALRYEAMEMPPQGKLPDSVIADFANWIDSGATDPRTSAKTAGKPSIQVDNFRDFWSFVPPQKPTIPAVALHDWPTSRIDHFILAEMEKRGLKPVPAADKRSLIRRATFDLTGLPPTPAEVESFVDDTSPEAFEKVVDRLLRSPAYGERWGRYWLDVARYSEDQAHTFSVKPNTSGFRYRDWVISAFNSDMPYDLFVKRQIAADLIESDAEERLRHLPALGYFGLGAQYYKNSDAAKAAADELDDRIDTLTRGFLGLTVSCARCHDHKFDPIPQQDYYSLAGIFQSSRLQNAPLVHQGEVDAYQKNQNQIKDVEKAIAEMIASQGPRVREASVDRIAVYMIAAWKSNRAQQLDIKIQPEQLDEGTQLDPKTLKRWIDYLNKDESRKLAALTPWFDAVQEAPADKTSQASSNSLQVPQSMIDAANEFQQFASLLLRKRDGQLPPDEQQALTKYAEIDQPDLLAILFGEKGLFAVEASEIEKHLSQDQVARLAEKRESLKRLQQEAIPMYPIAHVISEAKPADMKVFIRGNPANQGDVAPRRFLQILSENEPQSFANGSGRLELAEAIASSDNPLTARVMVNRVWQHHFGSGIVGTPDNFGALGESPTHPELLDYLTDRLLENGWSIKSLHREIMLSATYQLSSHQNDVNMSIDGDNQYLWRMNRRRLEIEAWRDALLSVSGKLDPQMEGPSTNLADQNNSRRTVYAFISRHELNNMLRLFDFPDANITASTRSETTVPQQQLFVLNSPFMIEQAKAFARRLANEAGTDIESRVRYAFTLAYGRPVTDAELLLAKQYLSVADDNTTKDQNSLNRWERYAQVLLGSNEFMYLD